MANSQNVHLGIADLTLNGNQIGHTKEGVEITVTPSVHEVKVDKYGEAPLKVVGMGTRVEVKVNFAESNHAHISQAIAEATYTAGATKDQVGIGKAAGQEIVGVPLLLHPVAAGADTDLDWNFHKVVPIGAPTIAYKNGEERVIEATFLALVDETQPDGETIVRIGTAD